MKLSRKYFQGNPSRDLSRQGGNCKLHRRNEPAPRLYAWRKVDKIPAKLMSTDLGIEMQKSSRTVTINGRKGSRGRSMEPKLDHTFSGKILKIDASC